MIDHERNRALAEAHNAVQQAVVKGRMRKPRRCEVCGVGRRRKRIIYHHWSYEERQRLSVIPLCCPCHDAVHRGTIPEPRTGRIYELEKPYRSRGRSVGLYGAA